MRYDVVFIGAALSCWLVGEGMGIYVGMVQDFMLSPVHAHLTLLGWVTLAVYGILNRAYSQLATSRLAGAQAVLAISGAVLMPEGIAAAMLAQFCPPALVGPLAVLAATLMFAFMFARRAART